MHVEEMHSPTAQNVVILQLYRKFLHVANCLCCCFRGRRTNPRKKRKFFVKQQIYYAMKFLKEKFLPFSELQKLSGGKIVSGSIPCCKGRSKAALLLLQKENAFSAKFPTISLNPCNACYGGSKRELLWSRRLKMG